jgi:hypothetical protein
MLSNMAALLSAATTDKEGLAVEQPVEGVDDEWMKQNALEADGFTSAMLDADIASVL